MLTLMLAALTPVYSIDFDKGLDASNGDRPTASRNVRTVDGVRGKAVWVEEKDGRLEYALLPGLLTPTTGAVSVWFRMPEDAVGGMSQFDRDCNLDRTVWGSPDSSRLRRPVVSTPVGGVQSGSFTSFGWGGWGHELNHVGLIRKDEWHHYVIQRRNGFTECYLDGILFFARAVPKNFKSRTGNGDRLLVGCSPAGTKSWGGAIDELRLFDRALTPEEVSEEFQRGRGYTLELLDHAVDIGVEQAVRFRFRDLKTGKLSEYTRPVRADKAGTFQIRERDYVFELIALDPTADDPSARQAPERLIYSVDCTKEGPAYGFADCGSHVVTNRAGCVYRESDDNLSSVGFAYRFPIPEPGKPYWLEAEYPDDARREYTIAVYPENVGIVWANTLDCFGVMTGVDHPVTGKLGKKRLLFWADTTNVAVAVLGYLPFPGSKNPACASFKLYSADLGLADKTPAPSAAPRTVGVWDEDPTMDAHLGFAHFNGWPKMLASLEFYRHKWQHVLDYMKYHHLNSWVLKSVDYRGDVCAMPATFLNRSAYASGPGRVPGWDDLGAKMLDAAGHDIWARLNWRHGSQSVNWLARLGGRTDTAGDDSALVDNCGKANTGWGPMKFYRKEVKDGVKALIAGYRDKYGVYPHFRGITLNEHCAMHFDSLSNGYGDETIALFEKETGIRVPAADPAKRYAYLVSADVGRGRSPSGPQEFGGNEVRKAWIEWRCRKVEEVARELVAELRAGVRKDLTVQFWVRFAAYDANVFRDIDTYDMDAALRGAGIDLKALNAIDGLRVVMTTRPDYCRSNNTLDTNEPYLITSDAFADCLNRGGVTAANVFRHSNYEVYHDVTANVKKWRNWWLPLTAGVRGDNQIRYYAEPQAELPYALEPFAYLVAMCDIQDLQHGWWGAPETGAHDLYRAFYGQFTRIPRGRFDLLKGWKNDPVAVRVSSEGKGWYVVNREGYDVELTYAYKRFFGKGRKTLTLGPCELRYFGPDEKSPLAGTVSATIAPAARRRLDDLVDKLREMAKEPAREELRKAVLPKLEAAYAAEEWSKVRALSLTTAARSARMANVVTILPRLDPDEKKLTFAVENNEKKDLIGTVEVFEAPKGWTVRAAKADFCAKAKETGKARFRFDVARTEKLHAWERFGVKVTTPEGEQRLYYRFPRIVCTPRGEARNTEGLRYYSTWSTNKKAQELLKERFGRELVANASVQYDGKGVWIEADVLDPDYVPPKEYGRFYDRADSLQLYFDVRNDGRSCCAEGYDPDDVVFQAGELDGKGLVVQEHPTMRTVEGATVVVTRKNKEWTNWVVFIPKAAIPGLRLEKGSIFGFGLQINQLMRHPAGDYAAPLSHGPQYRNPGNWFDAEVK